MADLVDFTLASRWAVIWDRLACSIKALESWIASNVFAEGNTLPINASCCCNTNNSLTFVYTFSIGAGHSSRAFVGICALSWSWNALSSYADISTAAPESRASVNTFPFQANFIAFTIRGRATLTYWRYASSIDTFPSWFAGNDSAVSGGRWQNWRELDLLTLSILALLARWTPLF